MRLGKSLLSSVVVFSVVVAGALTVRPPAAAAAIDTTAERHEQCKHDWNYPFIALAVLKPKPRAEVPVDEHGQIKAEGFVNKYADLLDLSIDRVVTDDFTVHGPPHGLGLFKSYSAAIRPPQLGKNTLCVRAERFHKTATELRTFTAVDLIPPSNVPGLTVSGITATSATVSWGAATDNYGLAGYDVVVDGGAPHRTAVGNRSYPISGLAPSSEHTVSVVAIDEAGNRSATPATATFTTNAEGPPPNGDFTFAANEGGAMATWTPRPDTEVSYRTYLDGLHWVDFGVDEFCDDPCTKIDYPIEPLSETTSYTFKVEAVGADGTVTRTLEGGFSTPAGPGFASVPTDEFVTTESRRCAGSGGDIYVAPTARPNTPVPAGSTQVFDGCYTVPDSSCIDDFLPPTGNQAVRCSDDVTRMMFDVAPPGRGPVISSVDDLGDWAGAPATLAPAGLKLVPTAICTEEPAACTIVVTTATQAFRFLALTGISAMVAYATVITIAGIAIGLALFALYEILFPSAISINGIFEYPIDFDTDFDTFENWTADEGEWVNSLKAYAETVKTIKITAEDHNIPFAWTDGLSQQLKRQIDAACSAQRGTGTANAGCDDDVTFYVPGGRNYRFEDQQKSANHIVAAMGNGSFPTPARVPWYYPARSVDGAKARAAGFPRDWFNLPQFLPFANDCPTRGRGNACDEFPFWASDQAVNLSGQVADLKSVPNSELLPQARDIGHFYRKCDVDDNDKFVVLPFKPWVDAGGPSFGFKVEQGSVNVCLAPTLP